MRPSLSSAAMSMALLLTVLGFQGGQASISIEDLRVPPGPCNKAATGDHLMIKYQVKQAQTGEDVYVSPEGSSVHVVLGADDVIDGLNIGLQRICEGGVRRITVPPAYGYQAKDYTAGPPMTGTRRLDPHASLDFYVEVFNLTKPEEFGIFEALQYRNYSQVLDLIEGKKGINAVDQYGATPLMIAVSSGIEVVVATLLNSWRPRVNVNARKPSGFSALFYAAANPKGPSIVRALLQRGADPNIVIESGENKGYTPLMFAAKFDAHRNALSLLEFGANPLIAAADGSTALDLAKKRPPSRDQAKMVTLLDEAGVSWREGKLAAPSQGEL